MDHFRGAKVDRFKYSPKKRIRVRGGHRQQYTRLMVDFIGKPGENAEGREAEAVEPAAEEASRQRRNPEAPEKAAKKEPAKKPAEKKAPAKKSAAKSSSKSATEEVEQVSER